MQILPFWTLRGQVVPGVGGSRRELRAIGEDHHGSDGRGGAGRAITPTARLPQAGFRSGPVRRDLPAAATRSYGISPPGCVSAAAANWPEDVAEGLCQQLRLGDGGEMPAVVVFLPCGDGEVALGELAGRLGEGHLLAAEDADRGGYLRPLAGWQGAAGGVAVGPVRLHRGGDGPGGPVEGEGAQEQVPAEGSLPVAGGAAPGDDLLADPGGEAGRRIAQADTQGRGLGGLLVSV